MSVKVELEKEKKTFRLTLASTLFGYVYKNVGKG
jgi:hypothetical protein